MAEQENPVCLSIFDDDWDMMICEFYANMESAISRIHEIKMEVGYEIEDEKIFVEEISTPKVVEGFTNGKTPTI
jgi:hypothetical protein